MKVPKTGDLLLIYNASKYNPKWASHYGKRTPLSGAVKRRGSLAGLNLALTALLLVVVGEIWVAALATVVVEGIGAIVVMPILARRRGVPGGCLRSHGPRPLP